MIAATKKSFQNLLTHMHVCNTSTCKSEYGFEKMYAFIYIIFLLQ